MALAIQTWGKGFNWGLCKETLCRGPVIALFFLPWLWVLPPSGLTPRESIQLDPVSMEQEGMDSRAQPQSLVQVSSSQP